MDIQIQAVHFAADAKLEEFIEGRLSKLTHFYDNIIGASVYLKVDKAATKDNKIAEVKLEVPGNDLFAIKHADSFEAAVDEAIEALRRQIIKKKSKQMAH